MRLCIGDGQEKGDAVIGAALMAFLRVVEAGPRSSERGRPCFAGAWPQGSVAKSGKVR